jgi:serine/threonine-protein kinase
LRADGTPVLTDFGLLLTPGDDARRLTQSHIVVGTADYVSPEQVMGWPIDGRSDVYALGAVLHEMLVGYPPFLRADPYQTLRAHVEARLPSLPPRVPPAVRHLVERALAKQPDDRFPTAAAMGAAIRTTLASLPT